MKIVEALDIIKNYLAKRNTKTNTDTININTALVNFYKENPENEFYLTLNGVESLIKK